MKGLSNPRGIVVPGEVEAGGRPGLIKHQWPHSIL